MTTELRNIIDLSYSIFGKYRVTAPLDVCTECCMSPNQMSALASMSVKDIPVQLLYEYNTAAKTALPKIEEFKHFLPRFLELTAELKYLHHSAELILSRFEYYSKEEWAEEEYRIIQDFAKELFRHFLSIYPLPELEKIDSIIIMLYKTKIDVLEILLEWKNVASRNSVLHLSDLVTGSFKGKNNDILSSGFADRIISKIVYDWLNTDYKLSKLKTQVEEIIMQPQDLDEWQLNQLNWTYEKLNELDYKREKK